MKKVVRFCNSLSTKLQFSIVFLSLVGVTFGVKSYLHVREVFGESASEIFYSDLWVQIIIAFVINVVIAFLVHGTAIKPINSLNEVMRQLTENKLDFDIPYINRPDQIGSTARKAKIFQENAKQLLVLKEEQETIKQHAQEEKRNSMESLANTFENVIGEVVSGVSGSADELQNTASALSSIAQNGSQQASTLTDAAQNALMNVSKVSFAADELSSSINEISDHVKRSNTIAQEAAHKGEEVSTQFEELVVSTRNINNILKIIDDIADQINLLALNATIEAARAGEAGRGFAVVASEVMNLAKQTGDATANIAIQIQDVSTKTDNTSVAITDIIQTISDIRDIASETSEALEKQSKSTENISSSILIASQSTHEVLASVEKVSASSAEVGDTSLSVSVANENLSQHSKTLKNNVEEFIQSIRKTVE